jgi:hypothetical protein
MCSRNRETRTAALITLATLFALASGVSLAGAADDKKGKIDSAPPTKNAKLDSASLSRTIDKYIDHRLADEKVPPSPRADDAAFLRRAYLDITGRIPSADKAVAFLDNQDPTKRTKLIDELLASPEYATHQADIWQALLLPRNSDSRRVPFEPMVKWLEDDFKANKPWDKMIHDLLTATGEQDKNGAVTYFLANDGVDKMTDSVTKLFLGVQLQCAQCHNHPFTEWKQTEYWGMAAFFMKVQPQFSRPAAKDKSSPSVTEGANPRRKNALPDSAKIVPAKFLAGDQPKVDAKAPLRPVLADWLTNADNPYFSKAIVNRTWAQFFGRGLVSPVDDMHDANPASHPELLDELARQLAANNFDLKYLIRAICNSQAYQRSSKPAGKNADAAPELFSRMTIKVLTPEQLFDSLGQALGPLPTPKADGKQGKPPVNGGPRAAFVAFFGVEDGSDPTEYQAGIPQALRLMNAPRLNNAAVLNQMIKGNKKPEEIIEQLYLTTLSRRPTSTEHNKMVAFVQKHKDEPRQAYGDILWALLNCSEFATNH